MAPLQWGCSEPWGPPGFLPLPQSLQSLGEVGARRGAGGQAGPGTAEGALLGEIPAGTGLSSGSAALVDHSRGEEEPWGPAGLGPAGARPWCEAARGWGDGAGGCPAMAEPCAGLGPERRDWQGGEEAQEISQWLYGQHRVSCSSPGAGAPPGPDCAGPGRTPAPAPRRGPHGTLRLEGLCPTGYWWGEGTPLWGWGGSQPWRSAGSRAAPGDVLPRTETCPSTLLLLLCPCRGAGHPATTAGTSLAPNSHPGVAGAGTRPGLAPSSGAQRPVPLLPFSHPCPGSWELPGPSVPGCPCRGHRGDHRAKWGWSCRIAWCWWPRQGRDHGCAALGKQTRTHGRGDAAVFDPTLPPLQHRPHGLQLPWGLGRLL